MVRGLVIAVLLGGLAASAGADCPPGASQRGAAPPDGWSTWCEADGLRHGRWTMWHSSGHKMREGLMLRGKLQGRQVAWYADGQLAEESFYQDGVPVGIWRTWYPDGQIRSKTRYKRGQHHGSAHTWHPNGKLATFRYFRFGELVRQRRYDDSGRVIEPPPDPARAPRALVPVATAEMRTMAAAHPPVAATIVDDPAMRELLSGDGSPSRLPELPPHRLRSTSLADAARLGATDCEAVRRRVQQLFPSRYPEVREAVATAFENQCITRWDGRRMLCVAHAGSMAEVERCRGSR